MKPQEYLTKEGTAIFNEIVKHIKGDLLIKTDSYKLSMLADSFDVYAKTTRELHNQPDYKSTKSQLSTLRKQSSDYITKNSDAFGLTPAAREKILIFAKKKEGKKSTLQTLQNTNVA